VVADVAEAFGASDTILILVGGRRWIGTLKSAAVRSFHDVLFPAIKYRGKK